MINIFRKVAVVQSVIFLFVGTSPLISAQSGLQFLHVPMNAGSTIEHIANTYHQINWGSYLFNSEDGPKSKSERIIGTCSRWLLPPSYFPEVYTNKTVFCVSRNPYDRLVSEYRWLYQTQRGHRSMNNVVKRCNQFTLNSFVRVMLGRGSDGTLIYENVLNNRLQHRNCHMLPQVKYLHKDLGGLGGEIGCTKVIKFENLKEEFENFIFEQTGIKMQLNESVNVKTGLKYSNCNMSVSDLNRKSLKLISTAYHKDFEVLGYNKSMTGEKMTQLREKQQNQNLTCVAACGRPPKPYQDPSNRTLRALKKFNESKFQFIHIAKNSGTTMEAKGITMNLAWGRHAFASLLRQNDTARTPCPPWHAPPIYWPEVYADKTVFCVGRDPRDRFVSEFRWLYITQLKAKIIKTCDASSLNRYASALLQPRKDDSTSFYISDIFNQTSCRSCHLLPQVHYIHEDLGGLGGKLGCTKILKMENLDEEFKNFTRENFGRPFTLSDSTANVRSGRRSKCHVTADDLSARSLMLIKNAYARDFHVLGYDPDAKVPPRKPIICVEKCDSSHKRGKVTTSKKYQY